MSLVSDSALRRALARARDGKTLDVTEAAVLLHARDEHLDTLLEHASRIRDAGLAAVGREGVITYSRKVFIPLTRLCRDRCGYCTFATAPNKLPAPFLSPDEVLEIAAQGAAMGCKEALFTLGDRPEDRWHQAREWLDAHGYDDTLSYVRAMAIRVLEETGLLPHLNPGVLSWRDLQRLKPVAPSMGMMLETTSRRLFEEKGAAHYGSPDKDPAVRLRVLEDAGRSNVPFTTGILIGIGETIEDRAESIFAIRRVAREYGGVQEVIVQNFRAKPDTAMRGLPDADLQELAATIAVARLVLGPRVRLQAPPNLVDAEYELMIRAGIDDWGGVSPLTPDHVNPRAAVAADRRPGGADRGGGVPAAGAADDLSRSMCWRGSRGWILGCSRTWRRWRIRSRGWLVEDAVLRGGRGRSRRGIAASGRVDLHVEVDTTGRTNDRRDDFDNVYGGLGCVARSAGPRRVRGALRRPRCGRRCGGRRADPAGLSEAEAVALLSADGGALDELARIADDLRAQAVGDEVTYVVNRNINFTNVCYTGLSLLRVRPAQVDADAYTLSLDQVADRAEEAWRAGATEVCMQGGIHPDLPGTAYFDLAKRIKARTPGMHIHAFSPMEVINGASRTNLSIEDWLHAAKEAGVDFAAGHGGGDPRRRRPLGAHQGQAARQGVDRRHHHRAPGGHPDDVHDDVRPRGHPRALGQAHQADQAGCRKRAAGFSEFVLLPFVHPARRSTWRAWPGRARPRRRTGPCTRWPGSCCTARSRTSSAPGSSSRTTCATRCSRAG